MNSKIVENYSYNGLGFPVVLKKVEMIEYQNEWQPKIDVNKVADEAVKKLATQGSRLTGNQVKFIRSYFSMPLREFGTKVVHESHMAVSKWEKKGDETTNMNENTEQVLRLYIIENIFIKTKTKTQREKFYTYFKKSKNFFNAKDNMVELLCLSNWECNQLSDPNESKRV